MKIKLINSTTDTVEEQWGTCELCLFVGETDQTTLYFRDVDTGSDFCVECWEYIPYYGPENFDIDGLNLGDFAYWLTKNEVPEYGSMSDRRWIEKMVSMYYETSKDQE